MDRPPLTPTEFASTVTAITSAFGDPTRRDIYLLAHEFPEGITAAAAAQRFDLHSNVARHHLDKLVAGGYLDVRASKSSGGAGRPSKQYQTTNPDVRLDVNVRHDDILVTLLGRALALLDADAAEIMAEEVGAEYGRRMVASSEGIDPQRSFRSALHVVADALSAHGFAAHAEKHGNQMLGELYGPTDTDTLSSLPAGDAVCVTTVTR